MKTIDEEIESLSPDERRELAIATAAGRLVTELLHEQLSKIENDAADSAEDTTNDEGASPVVAKVAVAIEWPAGAQAPELSCKLSYSLRRKFEESVVVDPAQLKLELVKRDQPAA